MDLQLFFADPDPVVFLNADPDAALQNCDVTLNLKNTLSRVCCD